ncbi:hypothetical protein PCE1_003846 [Barthelona sp. PCE]
MVRFTQIDPNTGLSPIAHPLAAAESKNAKLTYKVTKYSAQGKFCIRGLKAVTRAIKRRSHQGLVVIAGNIAPMDVITHLPALCRSYNIPFVFVPSKEDLAKYSKVRNSVSVVFIPTFNEDYLEGKPAKRFNKLLKAINDNTIES